LVWTYLIEDLLHYSGNWMPVHSSFLSIQYRFKLILYVVIHCVLWSPRLGIILIKNNLSVGLNFFFSFLISNWRSKPQFRMLLSIKIQKIFCDSISKFSILFYTIGRQWLTFAKSPYRNKAGLYKLIFGSAYGIFLLCWALLCHYNIYVVARLGVFFDRIVVQKSNRILSCTPCFPDNSLKWWLTTESWGW